MASTTYTYRGGKKLPLTKSASEFVVRATPERLQEVGITGMKKISPHSSKVITSEDQLNTAMERARRIGATDNAYYEAESGKEFLTTDRVLVTFREVLQSRQVDEFAGRFGLVLQEKYSDRDYLFQLTEHTGMSSVELVVQLTENESMVETAENDLNYRATTYQPLSIPTDPNYPRQWHLHKRLQDQAFDTRASARCEEAWEILENFGNFDVVVGVTDDGCKLDHHDFNSPGKFAGWGYFRGNRLIVREDIDAQPSQMYKPGANHGTSCAGVIGGEVDAVLTVGAAPGCRLLPIQWESDGPFLLISDSKLLTALNYLADKVDVLSNSWGSSPNSMYAMVVVNRIKELAATEGRRGKGIVFLWAAGNENCPIQHSAAVDVPFDDGWQWNADDTRTWVGVSTSRQFRHNLADLPGVMYIAALASNATRSHYSNYGTGIALCAPSNNVHEYRRLTVVGLGVTTTTGSGSGVTPSFGGTSSATPLTAGVAALTISANPNLSAAQVISVLKQTASKDLSFEGYPRTPSASFDPSPTWDVSPIAPFDQGNFANNGVADGSWSPWFGHGRVDAAAAVAEARRLPDGNVGNQVYRQVSVPVLHIPDNDPAGVRDTVRFPDSATAGSVKVTVDITHTYIGDLRLTLAAPSGTTVVLHDRNGGRTQNLKKTFDPSTTAGLTALSGQAIQGTWTLFVQDLAAIDTGLLNRWEVEISGQQTNAVEVSEAPGVSIPDNSQAGIERLLHTAGDGSLRDIAVSVDITHTYIGDLSVSLIAPNGTSVALHERSGGDADNLIKTYTPVTTSGLASLRGQPVQGAWRLRVADLEARDTGKLNRWALKISP
ncbi:MAG: proprotein convertase P-domain-containing protein [Nitrospira sp.]|nr:proprotein convertase P-domain-containing protein [Nitrospira sp.]